MTYKYFIKLWTLAFFLTGVLSANDVLMVSTHQKSNGTLLRIVTSEVTDIDDIAGWVGQENWFYITINATDLSKKLPDFLDIQSPIIDLETTENNESVQLGFLFNHPIEDFEIFHSEATRVILIQVWASLSDSLRSSVASSENQNNNRVFSLPKQESKGSPFYDSFIFARDKYGPEKYFVWYNDWYSTKDVEGDDASRHLHDPKPLVVKQKPKQPAPAKTFVPASIEKDDVDISFIINRGMLVRGLKRHQEVKALQRALIALGYDLGSGGVFGNGVDGDFGPTTETVVKQFQRDRGFTGVDVDGIVGQGTFNELNRALNDEPTFTASKKSKQKTPHSSVMLESPKEILKKPSVKKNVKRETRKLNNPEAIATLPPDLSQRQTYLKITSNLDGANVFIDGTLIGQTPLPNKLSVTPGWHRVRVINPKAEKPKYAMNVPDYQDVFIPKGRTQKIRINLAEPNSDSSN